MKKYIYKAKKGPNEIIEGEVFAQSTSDAVEKINKNGFVATFVKEDQKSSSRNPKIGIYSGISVKELIIFTRQLSNLMRSGIPILRALSILSEQTQNNSFKNIIDILCENVKNGRSLSSALSDYPKVFPPFYRAMVSSGENSGALYESLRRISEYYKKKSDLNSKVRMALAYPLLILVVGIGTLIFVFTNVIPKILPIIINLKVPLPLPTKILIGVSGFLFDNWIWIIFSILLITLILARAFNNKQFRSYFSKIKLKCPILGEVVLKSEIAQFGRAVSMALNAGINIINAIDISLPILSEYGIISAIGASLNDLKAGRSFGESLKRNGVFPPFVCNLVLVGEESGNLEESWSNIAETYENDCEDILKTATNLLEPVMVLIIGILVGFIVTAVLLPIFDLNVISL